MIAINYLKGFFLLDVLSSIPFNLFLSGASANKLLRILKIPRLIRMLKLAKVLRLKDLYKGTALSYFIKINGGIIKIIGLTLMTILILHFAACIFSAIALFSDDKQNTWISRYDVVMMQIQQRGPSGLGNLPERLLLCDDDTDNDRLR